MIIFRVSIFIHNLIIHFLLSYLLICTNMSTYSWLVLSVLSHLIFHTSQHINFLFTWLHLISRRLMLLLLLCSIVLPLIRLFLDPFLQYLLISCFRLILLISLFSINVFISIINIFCVRFNTILYNWNHNIFTFILLYEVLYQLNTI